MIPVLTAEEMRRLGAANGLKYGIGGALRLLDDRRLRLTLQRIDALPTGLRDVIRLRVLNDQPTEQVCQALEISEENLFVRLHRARKQLLC